MKKLNIKRLAAIGAGAVLLGAAASAAFTDLTKTDIINETTGVPAISIVGGSNAAVSDFVWAGNIAAKVAQLATKPMSVSGEGGGTPTDLTVDLTVGGTRVITGGARELNNVTLHSGTSGNGVPPVEYYESIGSTYFSQFFNGTVNRTIDGNASASMTVIETLGVKAEGKMDLTSNIKDLVAVINSSDMNYNVSFSPGIPYPFTDTGSDDYVPLNFLGKSYLLDKIDSTPSQVVLIKDGADQILTQGNTFTSVGRDGKTYTIRFDGGSLAGTTPVGKFSLLDDQDVVVTTINNATANGDIVFRNTSGQEILATRPRIPANGITTTTENNTTVYFVQVITGTGRIEIQSGREVPYDPSSNGSNIPWVASFTTSGSNLTGITIKNSSQYNFTSSNALRAVQALHPASYPTKFEFFSGTGLEKVGTFEFQGFYDAGVQKSKVEFKKGAATGTSGDTYGYIHYFDAGGTEHNIPMAIKLQATSSSGRVFSFDGTSTQSYWTNSETDINKFAIENDSASIPMTTADYNVTVLDNDTNWDSSAIVVLKGKNGVQYKYLTRQSATQSAQVWLLLVGGSQSSGDTTNYSGFIDTLQYNAGNLFLLGTSVNDANILLDQTRQGYLEVSDNNAADNAADSNRAHRPYYWPDIYDFNGQNPGSGNNNIFRTAIFRVQEDTGTADTAMNAVNSDNVFMVFWDTENGSQGTIATEAIGSGGKTGWAGTLTGVPTGLGVTTLNSAVYYRGTDQNLVNFSEYNGDPGQSSMNYKKAYTVNGSRVDLANRELTMWLPDRQMKSYFTIKSAGVTSEVKGGEKLTDLNVGSVGETPTGTKVTIDNITGTCAAGSGACVPATYDKIVPVDSLVYTDTDATPSGKLIIVGGYFVNALAKDLTLGDGSTLQDALTASGDYVAEKLESGDIVVAGYTAIDTGKAAQELINALDALMG